MVKSHYVSELTTKLKLPVNQLYLKDVFQMTRYSVELSSISRISK